MTFDEKYYTQSNYAGYLERRERYARMMQEIEYDLFRVLKLDFKGKPVLDYGCGTGFTVKAMQELGYSDAWGYDISSWAVRWGREHLQTSMITTNPSILSMRSYELVTAFDVLEHMNATSLEALFRVMRTNYLLVRIPLAIEDGGRFVLDVSENDPTHHMRFTRHSWRTILSGHGFSWLFDVNLGSFYDTDGVMCSMFRKS